MHVNWELVPCSQLFVIHSRCDKPTTQRVGLPDFFVIKGSMGFAGIYPKHARVCAVEFKYGRGELSPKQKEIATEMLSRGIPYLCTYSVAEAIRWTKETLEK
jgi:hypothetical protein